MVGAEVLRHPGVSGIAAAARWSFGRPEEIRARRSLALPWDMEKRGLRSAARSRWFMESGHLLAHGSCDFEPLFGAERSTFNVQRSTCNVQRATVWRSVHGKVPR